MATSTTLQDLANGKKPESPVAAFGRFMEKMKGQMALALPKHMNADRMTRLALTAFSTTPALQECTHTSIAASIMTAAQLGLEIGVQGQGYLIPYKGTCTFVPGWKGLVDLVARAGRATVWTGVVFEGDEFEYQLGDAPFVKHRPADDPPDDARMTHYYAVGRVKDAQMPVIEVWSLRKVEKHLKQYNKVGGKHYALKDDNNFEMYARKIVLLQVLKYMPASVELQNAITANYAAEEGKGLVIDGDFVTVAPDAPDPETGEVAPPAPPVSNAVDKAFAPIEKAFDDAIGKVKAGGPSYAALAESYAALAEKIKAAKSGEDADLILDAARHLPPLQYAELTKLRESLTYS